MEFYLCLSFIMGNLIAFFCFYLERAYYELSSKTKPKTKEDIKRETIEAFCKMKTIQAKLEVYSETLEFKREILNNIFRPENPDFDQIDSGLKDLIKLVNSKIIKYHR
ncbi:MULTISPECIES: hypothetical protein [Leptospira]|uniref:hypothetical protein n=1 Tax=Leptospira TaxID=171 RepID=UPI000292596B|nr:MULTISPECIES: hypothetical protein [Leptospira]EKO59702.1 hypothetical protein LEP1GSC082_3928 [Leptospira kirschneri str. H2]EMK05446.1 hypothetical protein LEP1GSC166_2629 [Leptospira kirschneri]KXZ27295.1 hypothetical protein AYB32_15025 [Leptospira kirschneri]KXZ34248.1 hypothetical protein AYB34_08590 [Leptospira sp. ZV016]